MMVSMETYLRRGRRSLQRLMLDPRVRSGGMILAYLAGGFLLSAAGLLEYPQPLAMGLICAASGWRAALLCLGAMAGYPTFWGSAGNQGIVWAASGGLLAVMLGRREEVKAQQPLMVPAIAAALTAVTGLSFQVFLEDGTPAVIFFLRILLALLSSMLFTQAYGCRDAVTDWLIGGVGVLALARVCPLPWLGLGYVAAGVMTVSGAFPAAALAGLGLDLARVTAVPMTAVLSMAWFIRLAPLEHKWQYYAAPGAACLAVMGLCRVWDPATLPGLFLGGALGALLPPRPELAPRRGETGLAQVRLELGAEVLGTTQRLLMEMEPPPIDRQALLDKARDRACSGCSARKVCAERNALTAELLEHPLDARCRKPGRLVPELRRAQDQLRSLKAQRVRQGECRAALVQQYRFLGDFLRSLADRLPRRGERPQVCFRVEVSARSRRKERANGDQCLAFAGPGCGYFVLLCDGMGTGLGAAQDGHTAAALLRQMLTAGFPPEHALESLNSLLALRGGAGAVTVDLAQLQLDTGLARIYKWGAAPSWVLRRSGAEKIGTAAPPPGISVAELREKVEKLSLRRGEVLILLSDGVDGEDALRLSDLTPDAPPGELAAKILERGCGNGEDDATAAVIRLRPTGLAPS